MSLGALYAAVAATMADVPYVLKTGDNTFHRYMYASDADLLDKLQPAMAKHGLCIMPTSVVVGFTESKTAKGKAETRADLLITYTLGHKDGASVQVQVPGSGADGGSADKAVYKAMTGAFKYALRQTFAVPTGNDPERAESPPAEGPGSRDKPPGDSAGGQGHHPSWEGERSAFCAAVGKLGITYDQLKAYRLAHDRPKPSAMHREGRVALFKELQATEAQDVKVWLAEQERIPGEEG